MNRRGFLTTLLKSGLYAAVVPQVVTHGLGLKQVASINPEWITREYRIQWLIMADAFGEDLTGPLPVELQVTPKNSWAFDPEKGLMVPQKQLHTS